MPRPSVLLCCLLVWFYAYPARAQGEGDPMSSAAQMFRESRRPPWPKDEEPCTIWRMVIVESPFPLVTHGETLEEPEFLKQLENWKQNENVRIAYDNGFRTQHSPEFIQVPVEGYGGTPLTLNSTRTIEPGPALRMRTGNRMAGLQVQAEVDLWSVKGLSLTRSFFKPNGVWPHAPGTAVECSKVAGTAHQWDSSFRTATALTGKIIGSTTSCYAVFLLPVSERPALKQALKPSAHHSRATATIVLGTVRSETFWPMLKAVRPDLQRPGPVGGTFLDLFWSDEKWKIFKKAMESDGARWESPQNFDLALKGEQLNRVFQVKNTRMQMLCEWPHESRVHFKVDFPLLTLEEGGRSVSGSQSGMIVPVSCESHHGRWNFTVRCGGRETYITAMKFDFE